ncbi:MAG TPA: hypothetical protein VL422_06015 [Miltoncostaea sp.]|nr:hypothetical protein [Miltoncostaea sp.]
MTLRHAVAAALGAAALAVVAGPAAGASRTVTVDGWWPRAMAFSDRALVWTEAASVRVDPRRIPGSPPGATAFTYYRAEAFRAALDRTGRRFTGLPETVISIRTSIAAMTPGALAPMPGGLVMAPSARAFAAPVVACCSPDGEEIDVDAAGDPGSLPTVAVEGGPPEIRWVQLRPDGTQVLRGQTTPGGIAPGERSAPGLVALAQGLRAWVDPAAPRVLVLGSDAGAGPQRTVALPGDARGVWAAPGVVVVAVRSGSGVALLRLRGGAPVRIWSGARLPRVAVGRGAVAIADGRRVLAARRGALRLVRTASRPVDGIGVDATRLAWVERGLRRGARVGVVRLAGTP